MTTVWVGGVAKTLLLSLHCTVRNAGSTFASVLLLLFLQCTSAMPSRDAEGLNERLRRARPDGGGERHHVAARLQGYRPCAGKPLYLLGVGPDKRTSKLVDIMAVMSARGKYDDN